MQTICNRFLGQLILWHSTTPENADAICRDGFRPSRKSGRNMFRQGTWFYHVTTFREGKATDPAVGFVVATDLDDFVRGRDYAHERDDTVVFFVPISPDQLQARLDWHKITDGQALVEALNFQWKCDVVAEVSRCCRDIAVPWSQKTGIAEMLWTLAPDRFFEAEIPHYMLAAEVQGLGLGEAARLVSRLRESSPRFLNELLRLYHRVFLSPCLTRATMVSAAKHMEPSRVLALAEGPPVLSSASEEIEAIEGFVGAVLSQLPSDRLVRGAIEMASMRHFPGNANEIQAIGDWVIERAVDATETAFHFIMFAGDSSPARDNPSVARDLAVRILRATGEDYFDRLLAHSDTDYHETLTGIMHAFAALGEERGVPFIAERLKDDRKQQRVAAIRALGNIGTPVALSALDAVANDKRKVVRNAVQQALGNS